MRAKYEKRASLEGESYTATAASAYGSGCPILQNPVLNTFVDQGRTWWVVEPFLCSGSQII